MQYGTPLYRKSEWSNGLGMFPQLHKEKYGIMEIRRYLTVVQYRQIFRTDRFFLPGTVLIFLSRQKTMMPPRMTSNRWLEMQQINFFAMLHIAAAP